MPTKDLSDLEARKCDKKHCQRPAVYQTVAGKWLCSDHQDEYQTEKQIKVSRWLKDLQRRTAKLPDFYNQWSDGGSR